MEEDESRSLLNDEPVGSSGADRFRRRPLARRLAQLIEHAATRPESTVFGIVGPWGSGKTSLLNFTRDALDSCAEVVTVEFNPWLVSSVDGLLGDFFAALLEHMPKGYRGRKVRKALAQYGAMAAPVLSILPGGQIMSTASTAAASAAAESLGTRRHQAEKALAGSEVAYLVVVDDIDRLQPDELLLLFKVIRLVGRLPNVHYLISYDEQSVLDALRDRAGGGSATRAMEYLEKIVQVPVAVPPLHPSDVDELFEATWVAVRNHSGAYVDGSDMSRYGAAYSQHIRPAIRQPRQIVRLFAQIDHHWPLIKDETDLVDLLLLTFVKMRWPLLYAALPAAGADLVTDTSASAHARRLTKEQRQQPWLDFVEACEVPRRQRDEAISLLSTLFPGVAISFGRADQRSDLRAQKRVGAPEYFDRYFQFGIPPDDVSDTQVGVAVADIAEGRAGESVAWLADRLAERPRLVVSKMRQAADLSGAATSSAPAVARFLIKHLTALRVVDGAIFSPADVAYYWLGQSLTSWSAEMRAAELPDILAMPDGLSAVTRSLDLLSRSDVPGEAAIEAFDDLLDPLLEAGRAAVMRAASVPLRDPELPWLLYYIGRLGRRNEIIDTLAHVLDKSAWTTLDFVACFVSVSRIIGTDIQQLGELAVDELSTLLPMPVILDAVAPDLDREQPNLADGRDISHAARVARALTDLSALRETRPRDLPTLDPSPIAGCGPTQFAAWSGDRPEVLFRAVAAVGPSEDHREGSARSLIHVEDRSIEAVKRDDLTRWLEKTAVAWGATEPAVWTPHGGSGPSFLRLNFIPAHATGRVPFAAQVTLSTNEGQVVAGERGWFTLTVDLGLNLLELDERRRPSGTRHASTPPPAPAALSLHETLDCLAVLLEASVTIFPNTVALVSEAREAGVVGLWVSLSGVELERVIDLTGLTRLSGSSSASETQRTANWPISGALGLDPYRTWAIATLDSMLQSSGYRNIDDVLS